jgi:ABC-2 type transport system ATP-binding protein
MSKPTGADTTTRTSDEPLLVAEDLVAGYVPELDILRGVHLEVAEGELIVIIGPNGAGKSTLINMIIDLNKADAGKISILGKTYATDPLWIKSQIGVLPEQELLNSEFSGMEQLRFTGLLYGLNESELLLRIKTLFRFFFDDESDLDKACGTYSTGMRKKLGLIAAVLHKPRFLILDEPFSGLDPMVRDSIVKGLLTFLDFGKQTLIIATHEIDEIESLLDEVILLKNGNFIAHQDVEHLRESDGLSVKDWMIANLQE